MDEKNSEGFRGVSAQSGVFSRVQPEGRRITPVGDGIRAQLVSQNRLASRTWTRSKTLSRTRAFRIVHGTMLSLAPDSKFVSAF